MSGTTTPPEDLDAGGLAFAIVWSRFNAHITEKLVSAATETLKEHNAERIWDVSVPGAFELPLACRRAADEGFDAIIALGCVIKGETAHFEIVAHGAAHGLMDVQLRSGVPIAFGVLTTYTEDQATARATGPANEGIHAAEVAIEMARAARRVKEA